ncbi:hypothetical protein IU436_27565 [Nocardia farcinica]|uniref:hypothetical protein n=1 Tax=Nocardia farcinica TaxID=37329 RepID=UPI001893B490|nr:hypothetical protein [Nocardia farcinica]MBF6422400.1 hypothetical protein [Nocardia farcinica]MBF6434101.1 hypothetical protein [Nocardia farcinica]MBF6505157.1 hypothetical protein [Nocardia farcinica]
MQMPPLMLASSGPAPADSSRWGLEWKWDGARCAVRASEGVGTLISRNGNRLTAAYEVDIGPRAGKLGL